MKDGESREDSESMDDSESMEESESMEDSELIEHTPEYFLCRTATAMDRTVRELVAGELKVLDSHRDQARTRCSFSCSMALQPAVHPAGCHLALLCNPLHSRARTQHLHLNGKRKPSVRTIGTNHRYEPAIRTSGKNQRSEPVDSHRYSRSIRRKHIQLEV